MKKRFIVASASPRRKELLSSAGYEFEIIVSDVDEKIEEQMSPSDVVMELAGRKAQAVSKENPDAVVLGCDTVVVLDNIILGKPKDESDAFKILQSLSGRTHCVYTGVCLTDGKRTESFSSCVEVEFYELSPETIYSYIETAEPMDKAGAYGIQGLGSVLVRKINGDYFSVVGLPLAETARALGSFEIKGKIKL